MSKRGEAVLKALQEAGASDVVISRAKESLAANFPEKVYDKAVTLLGIVTILLVVGGVALIAFGKATPDGVWVAVGAGVGGLAGIFTGSSST